MLNGPRRFLPLLLAGLGFLAEASAQQAGLPLGFGDARPPRPLLAPPCPANTAEGGPAGSDATDLLRAVAGATARRGVMAGVPELGCFNRFVEFVHTPEGPRPPGSTGLPAGGAGAFTRLAEQIREARSEVLVTNMQWDFGTELPGSAVAQAVADLYGRVRAQPAAYPQGMAVRLLLGGYPDTARPADSATQILSLARDLRLRGVPLADPGVGWRLSLLHYPYFPHSHVKMHVIDGVDLTVGSYNLSWTQLPREIGGNAQQDLGLRLRGPVAQAGVAAFDDLWRHSRELRCPPNLWAAEVFARCALGPAEAPSHPLAASLAWPQGAAHASMLYRRPGDDQSDRAHLALLGAARREILLEQVDFSPEPICWWTHLGGPGESCDPGGLGSGGLSTDNPSAGGPGFPPYLQALVGAMARGVKVRLLVMPNFGLERPGNRSGVALLREAARRLGHPERFEARYYTATSHTKAVTVDRAVTVVGSVNFHFSAWGPWGLSEAALLTDDPGAVAARVSEFEQTWDSPTQSAPIPLEWWQQGRWARAVR